MGQLYFMNSADHMLARIMNENMKILELLEIRKILENEIISTNWFTLRLPRTNCHIIQRNNNVVYCSIYKSLRGLFSKQHIATKKFGRIVCDVMIEKLKNKGFFTTDELPDYGLSDEEKKSILKETQADINNDLVAIFAYSEGEAIQTKNILDELLSEARDALLTSLALSP